MKTKSKRKDDNTSSRNTFSETLLKISYRFSLWKVFDDFLTMAMAVCTLNSATGVSYYEDEYLQTIAHYKESELGIEFSKAFAQLIIEMEERVHSDIGNDVLGDFFERELSHGRNGQFFTPYPICKFMASAMAVNAANSEDVKEDRPLRILDPACGSGRMLMAASEVYSSGHHYYGIDIDRTCVKMTALNLFLNGRWNSEVMCADALRPDDFVIAYHISLLPLGIFKIIVREKSVLWNMHRNSFLKKETTSTSANVQSNFSKINQTDSTQLDLFR